MKVEITPTNKLLVLGVDERSLENLAWCAVTYRIDRLFWIDGYLLCVEVYEKSFEHEIKHKEFPVSQVCYTKYPKYSPTYEVRKGAEIPIVNASDMRIYKSLVEAIQEHEKRHPSGS
ncbi:MAG: hypothetical protein ACE5L6_04175 [Candidatus Bathyarchaeia archaeon]